VPTAGEVAIVDELGKMELASQPFRDAVSAVFDRPVRVAATVQPPGTRSPRLSSADTTSRPCA
jgi:nucleoside-triphosphatase THEP1